jgi:hypothetical protein
MEISPEAPVKAYALVTGGFVTRCKSAGTERPAARRSLA